MVPGLLGLWGCVPRETNSALGWDVVWGPWGLGFRIFRVFRVYRVWGFPESPIPLN